MVERAGFEGLNRFIENLRQHDRADNTEGNLFNNRELNESFAGLFGENLSADEKTERQVSFFSEMITADMQNGRIGDGDIFNSSQAPEAETQEILDSSKNVFLNFLLNALGVLSQGQGETATPLTNQIQQVGDQAFPYDLNNYTITDGDARALRTQGYRGYEPGMAINLNEDSRLEGLLNNNYGIYTSSEQMTPEQIQRITQGRINTNLDPAQFGLNQEQFDNACVIASVVMEECQNAGKSEQETKRAMVIALATALGESSLRNLPHGMDGDNKGLFQQRPSCGWGTPAECMDPVHATRSFTQALLQQDFMNMRVTEAAQSVQRSAFPEGYAPHEPKARDLVNAMLA